MAILMGRLRDETSCAEQPPFRGSYTSEFRNLVREDTLNTDMELSLIGIETKKWSLDALGGRGRLRF